MVFLKCSETLCFYRVFEPFKKVVFLCFLGFEEAAKTTKMPMKISRKTGYLTDNASQTAIVAGLLV